MASQLGPGRILKCDAAAQIRVSHGAGELHIHGSTAPDELLDGSFGSGVTCDSHIFANQI
jgi:hypothetical protein